LPGVTGGVAGGGFARSAARAGIRSPGPGDREHRPATCDRAERRKEWPRRREARHALPGPADPGVTGRQRNPVRVPSPQAGRAITRRV